ncbi:MAG: serine hydroxymethyltransferase [Candidatus Parcubacteria bacterium]|jgi:glycine hydroxymethyltransferase
MKFLKQVDPEIDRLIKLEKKRQAETLMMIPSENIASRAVEEAIGSVLGNKYAEGYPQKRYYQGQSIVDQVESLVIERAKKLFDVPAANVQPLSGSPANFAVFTALLQPGDTLMGLSLQSGGHLTHGAQLNASSKYFNSVPYEVTRDGMIDYVALRKQVKQVKPKLIIAGTTAYARLLEWEKFAEIADEVGAYLMADVAHVAGLIAANAYPSPVPFAHVVTTTTHKTLRGPRGALILTTRKGLLKDPQMAEKIDKAIIPGIQGGPHINTIAGIGVALKEATTKRYQAYAKQIVANAKVLADELASYGFHLVTGGTDCHLVLIDLRNKNLLGNTVATGCEMANIVLNRNAVPFDTNPPFSPSGIRLGTPGITTRGMKQKDMKQIAKWIHLATEGLMASKKDLGISDEEERKKSFRQRIFDNTKILHVLQKEVKALCAKYPIPDMY